MDGSSSQTLKDRKSQQISDLEDELAIVDEWIVDIGNLKSDEMSSPDWQPELIMNPLYAEKLEMIQKLKESQDEIQR